MECASPHVQLQVNLDHLMFSQVLLESGVRPTEISYVEAHGTGTVAGKQSVEGGWEHCMGLLSNGMCTIALWN